MCIKTSSNAPVASKWILVFIITQKWPEHIGSSGGQPDAAVQSAHAGHVAGARRSNGPLVLVENWPRLLRPTSPLQRLLAPQRRRLPHLSLLQWIQQPMWNLNRFALLLKADSYFDAWRLTHDGPKNRNNETVEFISYSDGWRMTAGWRMTVRLTHDGSLDAPNPNRAMLYFVWASSTFGPVRTITYSTVFAQLSHSLLSTTRILTHANSE